MDITLNLHSPGMTALHRAGLGGLAATLRALERNVRDSLTFFPADRCPGHPWPAPDQPPWEIQPNQLTLHLGEEPDVFLKRLFNYAFQITPEGLIYLPGQSGGKQPPVEILAAIQEGLLFSFLQHGKTRTLTKASIIRQYDVGESAPATVRFKACSGYKHQELAAELVRPGRNKAPALLNPAIEIPGPLYPGAAVRHLALGDNTRISEPAQTAIPLIFAPIGCLTLVAGHREGILLVPEVSNLILFGGYRPFLNPASAKDCQVAGAADAALQAQVRLRMAETLGLSQISSCEAYGFRALPWSTQQKSRRICYTIRANDSIALDRFEIALRCLAPRLKVFERKGTDNSGPSKEAFWTDSVVRPLVAENLALGLPWYQGFTRLMTALDERNRPLRNLVGYEKSQLHQLTKNMTNDQTCESRLIEAVHAAMRARYGQIASENEGNPVAMKKRFAGEYDRLRLALAGAKTPDTFRNALCGLFAKAGRSQSLQDHWQDLLPLLRDNSWQLSRDLSLLALASYKGRGAEALAAPTEEPQDADVEQVS